MTKTKTSSRNSGCLIRRRQCPCGQDQCYVQIEGEEQESSMDPMGSLETEVLLEASHHSSEIMPVDATPHVGQSFRSDDEAEEFYCSFARKNGFSIRRERSKGSMSHPKGIYKRELVCYRAGSPLPRKSTEVKRQRNKKSTRCNCEAEMVIKKDSASGVTRWIVVKFNNIHNHEMLDSNEVRFLPAYRSISAVDRERILSLYKGGCTVNAIMRALEMEKGLKQGELTFTERDLRNFLQSSKNINPDNEGAELLKVCKSMKEKNADFCYEHTMDNNNKLEHVAWSYGDSVRAYQIFGDVVVFDTSYYLYAYDRPLGVWLGVDNHGNTIFFGSVLLRDDTSYSFRWALQSFLRLMNGKFPQTVLTDPDSELKGALQIEWPHTKHIFSTWHVLSKLPSWFSYQLGPLNEKFKCEFNRLYNLETVEEFELQWAQMVMDFGLTSDRHIDYLFFHRAYWALPYLRDFFSAGLMMSGRSLSINSFFKEFLNSKTRLKDFIGQVCLAVDFQNQAAEEATIQQKYQTVKIKTCLPIEEHASTILTPYAFYMLQYEIMLSVHYAVFETAKDNYLVRHHSKTEGGHSVQWIPINEDICCSCKQFESSGIICGHSIRVLSLKNYFFLPHKYLPVRWRIESSLVPKSRGNTYRSQVLRTLATILIQESSTTKERFNYVQGQMSKLLTYVRCMPSVDGFTMNKETFSLDGTPDALTDGQLDPALPTLKRGRGRTKKVKDGSELANETLILS